MDLFFCRPRIRILTDQVVDTAGNKADHSHTRPERKKHKKVVASSRTWTEYWHTKPERKNTKKQIKSLTLPEISQISIRTLIAIHCTRKTSPDKAHSHEDDLAVVGLVFQQQEWVKIWIRKIVLLAAIDHLCAANSRHQKQSTKQCFSYLICVFF